MTVEHFFKKWLLTKPWHYTDTYLVQDSKHLLEMAYKAGYEKACIHHRVRRGRAKQE